MKDYTLEKFESWHEVDDYESDEFTVTLLDINRTPIAKFNYPKFTADDFMTFKTLYERI